MPPVDRKNPKRSPSSSSTYSLMEFTREFPDDDACLEWLWRNRFSEDGKTADCPKCGREGVAFKKYATAQRRQTWTCTQCGHHVQPTAGTIFHGSSTSLHLWFYAIHLMTSTRCGIAAKQLERELGVTYKTAWRMFNLIRNDLMAQDDEPLSGEVEVDETSVEGRPREHMNRSDAALYRERSRATVVAAVERGGRMKATVLPGRRGPALKAKVIEWVRPESIIYTDEWPAYSGLDQHFAAHSRVVHSAREYVRGDWHTNTVEGFFGNLKTGIRGNYKKVSRKWLQGYLNEFVWRYNHRATIDRRSMFEQLLLRAARS
jgi:transposase-like protein